MIEIANQQGIVNIHILNTKTGEVEENIIFNRITNLALQKIANMYDGINPDMEIKYLAIGTGSDAIDDTDTTLVNEIFRTPLVAGTNTATGEFTSDFLVIDSDAVAEWQEIGFFCGSTASSSANTGSMLSRILYHRDKTASEQISFNRIDKIRRG